MRPVDKEGNGDSVDDGAPHEGELIVGAPRWVKVFGIIAVILIVLFLVLIFTRGPGGHGPRRHMSSASGSGIMLASLFDQQYGVFEDRRRC